MALAIKILGYDTIWNATISAPDALGNVTVSGETRQTNPNLEHANTAAPYSEDVAADFPPVAHPVEVTVNPSRIQESATY